MPESREADSSGISSVQKRREIPALRYAPAETDAEYGDGLTR
jgi:hypothetical protein